MSSFTQKRRSSSMTRTKSAKGFDFNKGFSEDTLQSQEKSEEPTMVRRSVWGGSEPSNMNFASQLTPFPRKPRRSSVEFADDLKICGFCRGEIRAGKDIFMYRGEVGFCSMECREERMTLDEIKEKEKLKSSRLASKAKNDVDHKLSSAKQNIISVSDVPTPVAGGKTIVPLSIA